MASHPDWAALQDCSPDNGQYFITSTSQPHPNGVVQKGPQRMARRTLELASDWSKNTELETMGRGGGKGGGEFVYTIYSRSTGTMSAFLNS